MNERETLLRRLDELVADIRSLEDVDAVREVVRYIGDVVTSVWPEPMSDDVADAVEREVGSLADLEYEAVPITPELERRHADDMRKRGMDVDDLTESELDAIADSEIPENLRWNSTDVPGVVIANITRALGKHPGVVVQSDGDKVVAFKRPESLRQPADLVADLGLVGADAALMKAKWSLMRITALAIEEHGIAVADIAAEIAETPAVLQRWLDYVVKDVSLDRLAAVYHAVAEKAGLWPLDWLIGGKPGE